MKIKLSEWEIAEMTSLPDGNIEAIMLNPDPTAKVKKMKIIVSSLFSENVLSFSYVDESGQKKVFVFKDGKYVEKLMAVSPSGE